MRAHDRVRLHTIENYLHSGTGSDLEWLCEQLHEAEGEVQQLHELKEERDRLRNENDALRAELYPTNDETS